MTAFAAFEAAGWETRAAGYERFLRSVTARLADPLLDAAAVIPATRLLDLATGPGDVAAAAHERGARVVGVDIAAAMVDLARRLRPELDIRRADAEELPFRDGAFDAAVGNFAILHMARPERAAAELVRVLAPGGRVALTTWDRPERTRLLGVLVDAVAETGAPPPEGVPEGPPFFRFADDGEFGALLAGAGLHDVRVRTVTFAQTVADPEELWTGLLDGTVRMAALVARQPGAVRQRIRTAFDRLAREHAAGDRLELPVSVKIASGRLLSAT